MHAFENRYDADAKFLAVVTPGVLGPAYFDEVAAVLAEPPEARPISPLSARSCAATASRRRSPRSRAGRADVTYLIVGIDRRTLVPWHRNLLGHDPASASSRPPARRRPRRQLIVAAVIGPSSSILDGHTNQPARLPKAA